MHTIMCYNIGTVKLLIVHCEDLSTAVIAFDRRPWESRQIVSRETLVSSILTAPKKTKSYNCH